MTNNLEKIKQELARMQESIEESKREAGARLRNHEYSLLVWKVAETANPATNPLLFVKHSPEVCNQAIQIAPEASRLAREGFWLLRKLGNEQQTEAEYREMFTRFEPFMESVQREREEDEWHTENFDGSWQEHLPPLISLLSKASTYSWKTLELTKDLPEEDKRDCRLAIIGVLDTVGDLGNMLKSGYLGEKCDKNKLSFLTKRLEEKMTEAERLLPGRE